jgi:hypothetical protein
VEYVGEQGYCRRGSSFLLGIHTTTAADWARAAGGDWSHNAAELARTPISNPASTKQLGLYGEEGKRHSQEAGHCRFGCTCSDCCDRKSEGEGENPEGLQIRGRRAVLVAGDDGCEDGDTEGVADLPRRGDER